MNALVPLAVAIPLFSAALLLALSRFLSQALSNFVAIATGTVVVGICFYLLVVTAPQGHTIVYWFGGWGPRGGLRPQIDFVVDPQGCATALLAAVLTTLATIYGVQYFREVRALLSVLLLLFLGAVVGMSLTGDVFDLFVFFELSNISLYALTAYQVGDETALGGAISFVLTNSIGAFLVLFGITLLEGQTLDLNMATIGVSLTKVPAEGLIIAAFALISAGFFVRSALVPFHFWYVDSQSSAPAPLGILLSGVSIQLGLYAFARVYWTIFSGAFPHPRHVSEILVPFGAFSAIAAALMSLDAVHLKRMLAFCTVSHVGVFLMGIGMLTTLGFAGASLQALAYGPAIAALLMCAGICIDRFNSGALRKIWGRGRDMPLTAGVFFLAVLAAIGIPPFGTFAGLGVFAQAARSAHEIWTIAIAIIAYGLCGGALLRTFAGVFFGWGRAPDPDPTDTARKRSEREGPQDVRSIPKFMLAPAAVASLLAIIVGMWPSLPSLAQHASALFTSRHIYAAHVLGRPAPPIRYAVTSPESALGILIGLLAGAFAVLSAAVLLYPHLIPQSVRSPLLRVLRAPVRSIEWAHSGRVNDYVTWLIAGCAAIGGMFYFAYR